MTKPNYKYCFVPLCTSTSVATPNKLFFSVPKDVRRKKWTRAVNRAEQVAQTATHYCCEDHFNLEDDAENLMEHKLTNARIRLKFGVVPHIFNCQPKRTTSHTNPKRSAFLKRQSYTALNDALLLSKENHIPASESNEDINTEGECGFVMKEESYETFGPVMIGEEDLHDNSGVSVMKEEVLSEDDAIVRDISAPVENNDKCNETVETVWIPITKHEPCWSNWGVQNVGTTEKKLFTDEGKVQSGPPITEEAPKYSNILKQEFVDTEFVCMDSGGMEAWDEINKKCVDPLADADDNKHYDTTIKHEFEECPREQHCSDTWSTQSRSRSPMREDCDEKKPLNSTLDLNISRERSPTGHQERHKCESCGKLYKFKASLRRHTEHNCGIFEPHNCESCGKTFKNIVTLKKHTKYACGLQELHKCESCDRSFTYRAHLLSHKKYDCGRQEPHKCETCDKTFLYRTNLLSHKKHDCSRQEPHKCESCGRSFNQRSQLMSHKKHDCGRQEPHKCESCGKTYKVIDNLRKHLKYDCGRQEPYKCESCGKTFNHRAQFLSHKKHDCGHQEPHKCKSCNKSYKVISDLRKHMKHDCGRQEPHKCTSCGKLYKCKASLWRHMKHNCGKLQNVELS